MSYLNTSARDLQSIIRKLSLERASGTRSKHPVYWYILDGKKQLRVTLPNIHGGSNKLSPGFIKGVRDDLRLSSTQLVDLVKCPLSADDYADIIRQLYEA